ncbi:unnamed protein product, partial [marine sediment metagenome]
QLSYEPLFYCHLICLIKSLGSIFLSKITLFSSSSFELG